MTSREIQVAYGSGWHAGGIKEHLDDTDESRYYQLTWPELRPRVGDRRVCGRGLPRLLI